MQYGASGTNPAGIDYLLAFRGSGGNDTTGWARFSLSILPAWAVITDLKVLLACEADLTIGSPTLQIDYSTADGWSRSGSPKAGDIPRSATVSNPFTPITAVPYQYQTVSMNLSTHDFSVDVADKNLTVGVTVSASTPGAAEAIYAGTDQGTFVPRLNITTCE